MGDEPLAPTVMWAVIAMPNALLAQKATTMVRHKAKAANNAQAAPTTAHSKDATVPITTTALLALPASMTLSHACVTTTMTSNPAPMPIWAHKAASTPLATEIKAAAIANPTRHVPASI